jgi:hypothetical protein
LGTATPSKSEIRSIAVGNPQGLEGTFSQGIISGVRQVGGDTVLQITAPISPGSSGGPVLSAKGDVIGVSVATFKGGQNLNFAIPSSYLTALFAHRGPLKSFSQAQTIPSERSILSDLGDRNVEGVVGGHFAWTYRALSTGEYAISLRNELTDGVANVTCLVIFYASDGKPLEVDLVGYQGLIPPGMAKRVSSSVDSTVQDLAEKVEFRVLSFQLRQ